VRRAATIEKGEPQQQVAAAGRASAATNMCKCGSQKSWEHFHRLVWQRATQNAQGAWAGTTSV